jgi:GntR family transcriptional regulator
VRTSRGKRFIVEAVSWPEQLFPGLADRPIPNTVYDLFQKTYGVLVVRTDDRLSAVAADAEAAQSLGIAIGTPLLKIDRLAFGLKDRRIEWRVSLCLLSGGHYLARTR